MSKSLDDMLEDTISNFKYEYDFKKKIIDETKNYSFENIIINDKRVYDGWEIKNRDWKIASNNFWADSLKDVCKSEKLKKAASVTCLPVAFPTINWGPVNTKQFRISVLAHAVRQFNKLIPLVGIPVSIPSGKPGGHPVVGLFRGMSIKLDGVICVDIEEDHSVNCPILDIPSLRMNGIFHRKKSDGSITAMVIERLYAVDSNGTEVTIFSKI